MTADARTALYIAPGSCSRVAMVLLEEAGRPYSTHKVALMQGEQRQPGYLDLNPKGKVPLLVEPQGALSEIVAITQWLDAMHPNARLLPASGGNPWLRAQALSWLAWCATTLHPMIYRARMTARIHSDASTHDAIRAAALSELAQQFVVAEQPLADGRSWLMGAQWSAADMYLTWAFGRAVDSGLKAGAFPAVAALAHRQSERPAFSRMQEREAA